MRFDAESVRSRKMRIGRSGAFERNSDRDEAGDKHRGGGKKADRLRGRPACWLACVIAYTRTIKPLRDRGRSERVEMVVIEVGFALPEEAWRQNEHQDADRHVDEEDPRPAERAHEHPAEEDAGRGTAARNGSPDPQREVALAALAEGGHQDRERGRGDERRAEPLNRSEDDQRRLRPGEGRRRAS